MIKNENCDKCGLFNDKNLKNPQIKFQGQGKLKTLIVYDGPQYYSDFSGKHLSDDFGLTLRNDLKNLGFNLNRDFWYGGAINCLSLGSNKKFKKPNNKTIKCCRFMLEETIKEFKPRFVFLFGEYAIKSYFYKIFSSNHSPNRWRKLCIPDFRYNTWVIPMFSPEYVTNYYKYLHHKFFKDLKWALSCLNKEPPVNINHKEKIKVFTDFKELYHFLCDLNHNADKISIDYETTGLKPYKLGNKIVSIGIGYNGKGYSFPFQYNNYWKGNRLGLIEDVFKRILINPKIKKIAHNIQMEAKWSKRILGVDVVNWYCDTMNKAHVLDERNLFTSLNYQVFINWGFTYGEDVNQYKKSKIDSIFNSMDECPIETLCNYNGLDAYFTLLLNDKYEEIENKSNKKAYKFIHESIMNFVKLENNGIPVNFEYYNRIRDQLKKQIHLLYRTLYNSPEAILFKKYEGRDINLRSPKDMRFLLYKLLKNKCSIFTETKLEAVNIDALNTIDNSFTKRLLLLRKLEKANNTYISNIINETYDGRVFPNSNLNLAVTYRSSMDSPSIQNMPVRDENLKKYIRTGLIASKDNLILEVDFGGAEVRCLANYSKDKNLIQCLKDDIDFHKDWAKRIFIMDDDNIEYFKEKQSIDLRYASKNSWVFAMFYGSSPIARSEDIWTNYIIKNEELKNHLFEQKIKNVSEYKAFLYDQEKILWGMFPGIKKYHYDTMKEYEKNGFLETFFGFRYSGMLKYNELINCKIQGTSFHCLLWCFNKIMDFISQEKLQTKILEQTHDSIKFDTIKDEKQIIQDGVTNIMTNKIVNTFDFLIVPMIVDWKETGINGSWYDLK